MRIPLSVVVAAVGVVLAACSGAPPSVSSSSVVPSVPPCWKAVHEYAIVTDVLIEQGCIDPHGSTRLGTVTACKNGQRLWEMDHLVGLSGDAMVPEDKKVEEGIPARLLYVLACGA